MTQEYFDNLWRLIETKKFLGCRDRDSSRLRNFLDVETETHRDWKISGMSRPRLIETEKFQRCRDRDSSRPGNLMDVETETSRDWAKDVDTETPSRLLLISELSLKIVEFRQNVHNPLLQLFPRSDFNGLNRRRVFYLHWKIILKLQFKLMTLQFPTKLKTLKDDLP